jgi:hypothetical protein
MKALVSWPVARATASSRLRSAFSWIVGALFAAAAAATASARSAGIETFTGPSALWFALLTFGLGAAILSEEMESGHAQLVLLRPLTRAAWYGGRFAGAWLSLAIFCVIAWAAAFCTALARGAGFDAMRFASLGLALLWGGAWLSVLTCLGAFLPRWTNAAALAASALAWFFLVSIAGVAHKEWLPFLQTATKYLGPQDPLDLARPESAGRDFGPALYDLVWIFGPWLAGVLIVGRRELARRRS